MPLSDHEQRLLEQMEQQLLSDDPRFASTMRGPRTLPAARRRLVLGIVGIVAGLAGLVLGVINGQPLWVDVVAFGVMLGGVLYAMSSTGVRTGPSGVVGPDGQPVARPGGATRVGGAARSAERGNHRSPRSSRARGTFMQRLEQRWDRRRDER